MKKIYTILILLQRFRNESLSLSLKKTSVVNQNVKEVNIHSLHEGSV